MNDDDLPIRAELASAYLDGELDAAERARAAADPDTMALADSFGRVRETLGEVEPVPDSIRTAAISAALAEFEARQRVSAVAPARIPAMATVTVLRARWQRAQRVLGGVAAAAVIAVVGIAALKASNGTDSKSSSSATEPARAANSPAGAPQIESVAGPTPEGTTAAATADTSSQKMAILGPAVNNPSDLARYASGYPLADAATSAAPAGGATPAETQPVPGPASPPAACLTSTDTLLGSISVLGAPAYAVRDNSTGVVRAVDATDCRVLFSTEP